MTRLRAAFPLSLVLALAVVVWCDHSRLQGRVDQLEEQVQESRWLRCPYCSACGYVDELNAGLAPSADNSH